MKTEKDMLEHALKIAVCSCTPANVLVFYNNIDSAKKAFAEFIQYVSSVHTVAEYRTMRFKFDNGSFIAFRAIEFGNRSDIAGLQISHAFVTENVDYRCVEAIRSRVRTTKEYDYPTGVYRPWGAEVTIDY